MDYKGKKIAITGSTGFIGQKLVERLNSLVLDPNGPDGAVIELRGDVRNASTFADLNYTYDYLFHFAAPSSQVLFARDQEYCTDVTLAGFMLAARVCKQNGIKLIYPSTGLLSATHNVNSYARCKQLCEDYADLLNVDSLGLRIFATYGPGEGHKRDYASVPYLFARDMIKGKAPTIFGDGEQVRDFIYIDDTIQAILHLAEECPDRVVDIGSGKTTSFNQIIETINKHGAGAAIKPKYIPKPKNYVQETSANPARMQEFYQPKHTFDDGIIQLMHHLKGGKV